MNKQAYIRGFIHRCNELNVNPGYLLKQADWLNRTESRFDNPVWGDMLGRKVYKGRWLPFIFPSERRMDVQRGDTYESLSKLTGVPLNTLQELNGGKDLIAGGTFRVS